MGQNGLLNTTVENTNVPPLNGTTSSGSNPNSGTVTWRAEQQRQAADTWIYNDAALRQAMTSLGIPVGSAMTEDFIPGVPIPTDRPGQIVDPRALLQNTEQSRNARVAVAAKLGISVDALMNGIHAFHGIEFSLPTTEAPVNGGTTTTTNSQSVPGNGTPSGTTGTTTAGTPFALKSDPFVIKTARSEITGDAASLEAKRKELYDTLAAGTDPNMAAKKAMYDSSAAANAGWDAKNPQAQLKINQNYTMGHEVRLQVNTAATEILEQMKGMDPVTALNNLKATAIHPDLAKYKELQTQYSQLASQGKWGEASEILAQQHALVQGKSDLIRAIAAEKILANIGGDNASVSAQSIDSAIAAMKEDSSKVNADLKRLEIREYDVRLIMLNPPAPTNANMTQGGNSVDGGAGVGGLNAGQSGGSNAGVGGGQPVNNSTALPIVDGGPLAPGSIEALLRISLNPTSAGLISAVGPDAAKLGLKEGDRIMAVTGSKTKTRIANQSDENGNDPSFNDALRDAIWNNGKIELEVLRKDTGKLEKVWINIWKEDPNGRYVDGNKKYEEDVKPIVDGTAIFKPANSSNLGGAAGNPNNTNNGATSGGGSPNSEYVNYGLGISVGRHEKVFGIFTGKGAQISSLTDVSGGHDKRLEEGEDKIMKIQFYFQNGKFWKEFDTSTPEGYMKAIEELNKYNNSVAQDQIVTEAVLHILDTNGWWGSAKREQVAVPVRTNVRDTYDR